MRVSHERRFGALTLKRERVWRRRGLVLAMGVALAAVGLGVSGEAFAEGESRACGFQPAKEAPQVFVGAQKVWVMDGQGPRATALLVEGGVIKALGEASSLKGPKVVEFDASGRVITPGLVDIYTTLGTTEIDLESSTVDTDPGGDRVRAAFRVSEAFNPNSLVIPIQRLGGVTSVVSVARGGLVAGQAAWVDLFDERFHAKVIEPSVAMGAVFGMWGARATGGSRGGALLAYRELFDDVRFYARKGRDYDGNKTRSLSASRLDLMALQPVVQGQQPLMCVVHRASDIRAVLALSKSEGFKPIIVGGAESWMVADELAAAGVPVVLDSMANLPSSFDQLGARDDTPALLEAAGVKVALSTFSAHNVRNLRQMAGNAVRAGMSYEGALRAVTTTPAEILGVGARYGSLAVGKRANLVVWSGDPLEFSSRVERMVIGGREVSLDNRQRRLRDRYMELRRRGPALGPGADAGEGAAK